jgi:AAA domain-containing protein
LVAKLVTEGYDRRIILAVAPRLTRPGYTVDQTARELEEFIRGAEHKFAEGPAEDNDDWERPPEPARLDSWDPAEDKDPILPREWLLGRLFCREFVSSILGDGAVGKTAFRIACALSLAARRNLIGEPVWQRSRVLLVCFEDSRDELRRRVRAAMAYHNVTDDEVGGWLRLAAVSRGDLKFAGSANGAICRGRLAETLECEILEHKIDVLILDPFIKTHSLPENSNEAIDYVAGMLTELATKHRIAVDVPHHVRKGAAIPGDADAGRGATAAKDAFRLVYTMTKMSEETAKAYKLSDSERRSLVRVDSGKVNIAPPSDARWYRLVSVELGNGTPQYPHGDDVAVIEPWTLPDLFEGLTIAVMNAILDDVDGGLPDGEMYSDDNAATKRAAWKVVAKHTTGKNDAQCREIIRIWVRNGVLVYEEYWDKKHGRTATGLRVDPAKRPK